MKIHNISNFNLFPSCTRIVNCFLICLCPLVVYIANNMDPGQTAHGSSLIRVHNACIHGKSFMECI